MDEQDRFGSAKHNRFVFRILVTLILLFSHTLAFMAGDIFDVLNRVGLQEDICP